MGNRVGVVTTRSVAGPLALGADPGAIFLTALTAARGPANVPTLITSMSRFESVFGGPTPYSDGTRYSAGYEVLKAFFAKGGRRAYVLRIVAADGLLAAARTSVTLVDRATPTPQDTLTINAKGPGTFLDDWDIVIAAGTRTNTVKLTLLDDADQVVEVWDNLKMNDVDLARVTDGSDYIELVNEGSATAAPDNLPAVGTTTVDVATHGGEDHNAPVAADIVGTDTSGVKTGLKAFRSHTYGYGWIAAPDMDSDATVIAELVEQSESYFRVYMTSSQEGASVATAKTQRAALDAFNCGFYYPRPKVRDDFASEIKTISPVGHVIADWLKALDRIGPGKAPGGADFRVDAGVIALETQANGMSLIDEGVAEDLVANGINPIYAKENGPARVWGVRAATEDAAWQYLHAAFLWCIIGSRGKQALEQVVLDLADNLFFNQVELGLYGLLVDLHDQRAFRGSLVSPGETADPAVNSFGVIANESLLSVADKSSGNVRARIWFRPAGVAETIFLDIAKQNEVA